MEIHQLLPNFVPGDAIGNHARALQRHLRSWGFRSEIHAQYVHPELAQQSRPLAELPTTPHCVVIYHYSTLSTEAAQALAKCKGKKVILYHNITPAHFYAPYCPTTYRLLRAARASLGQFRKQVDLTLGVSAYNCAELAAAGYVHPRRLPLLLELDSFAVQPPCPAIQERYGNGWTNFLFVGRLAPHKRQEDVIRAFAWYNRFINRRSRLLLVGTAGGLERYLYHLGEVVASLEMEDHVVFVGHTSLAELSAYYRLAHVFVCMSEHEGFCVPLVEAMHHQVPILAYAAAGIPETLADAGVLAKDKDFPLIAEMAHLLTVDADLRRRVLGRQQARLADFAPEPIALQFRRYMEELIG
ncbi:MAG TPA: glycosyltransferase family 4 protein [Gemmataceae bacterium]|nr:glycosyltransferase family 4 protein [Gemmataceae bacterium]